MFKRGLIYSIEPSNIPMKISFKHSFNNRNSLIVSSDSRMDHENDDIDHHLCQ